MEGMAAFPGRVPEPGLPVTPRNYSRLLLLPHPLDQVVHIVGVLLLLGQDLFHHTPCWWDRFPRGSE